MSSSFDVTTESPASVEAIHAAFRHEDYWLARNVIGGANTTLDSLIIDADDALTVRTTQHLVRHLLPGLVAKLVPGDLKILISETWRPLANGQARGKITVSASPALGSGLADGWLDSTGNGSTLRFAGNVDIKVPLLGGKLEKSYTAGLAESFRETHRFTTTWIAEHA